MQTEETSADRDLVYRTVETAVFAPRKIAEWVNQIHHALWNSKTWSEFRLLMPAEEYERIVKREFDENGEPRPPETSRFEAAAISGVGDGDYPPWLAQSMSEWIPSELLEKYGTKESSRLNGDFWEIPEECADKLASELRELGYKVTEAAHLEF